MLIKFYLLKQTFLYVITKYVINIIKHTHFHITPCISPRPISALGPSALWLILVSRADTGCDMEMGIMAIHYYSLYINTDIRHTLLHIE